MLNREFILSSENADSILNKYEYLEKSAKEVFEIYLAKIEKVEVEKIYIKSILREKRLNGNTTIAYSVIV